MPLPNVKVSERISNLYANKPLSVQARNFLAHIPITLSIFFAAFLLVQWGLVFDDNIPSGPPGRGPLHILPSNISNLLGPYSPWYPVETYAPPPSICSITQVHILQRHGARFPTKGATSRIKTALSHIKTPKWSEGPSRLGFLRNYRFNLRTDDLMWFGATEAFAAGVNAYNRYSHLAQIAPPFLRAGDSGRVIDSGNRWKSGFELAGRTKLQKMLIISEEPTSNNTLADSQCPAHSDDIADARQAKWLGNFAPNITAYLNSQAPGSTLVDADIPELMSLCSYESLYHYATSHWCGIFELNQWEDYEYYTDLEKFYGTGPGNPYGRPQGIGWINELIARMTNSPVNDTTQANHTLDSNPETFPLNRTIYADFTHDNEQNAIFAAMGILRMVGVPQDSRSQDTRESSKAGGVPRYQAGEKRQQTSFGLSFIKEMDPHHPDPNRKWVASRLVPFSSRMVVEKLSCEVNSEVGNSNGADTSDPIRIDGQGSVTAEEYLRILINDAVVHVPGCSESIGNGICSLEDFLESQAYARSGGEGEWEKCKKVEEEGQGENNE